MSPVQSWQLRKLQGNLLGRQNVSSRDDTLRVPSQLKHVGTVFAVGTLCVVFADNGFTVTDNAIQAHFGVGVCAGK